MEDSAAKAIEERTQMFREIVIFASENSCVSIHCCTLVGPHVDFVEHANNHF